MIKLLVVAVDPLQLFLSVAPCVEHGLGLLGWLVLLVGFQEVSLQLSHLVKQMPIFNIYLHLPFYRDTEF